jgi:transcription elongation factor SPT6
VFGDGHDYEFALGGDEEAEYDEEQAKPELRYSDVRHLQYRMHSF